MFQCRQGVVIFVADMGLGGKYSRASRVLWRRVQSKVAELTLCWALASRRGSRKRRGMTGTQLGAECVITYQSDALKLLRSLQGKRSFSLMGFFFLVGFSMGLVLPSLLPLLWRRKTLPNITTIADNVWGTFAALATKHVLSLGAAVCAPYA